MSGSRVEDVRFVSRVRDVVARVQLDGLTFAGIARPAGVLGGGVLAVRGAPFVAVVVAAAATAALLRLLGVA